MNGRTDGRMDGQTFFEKVFFFPPDQEYILYTCLYLSRLFLKFYPPVTKVSIPFVHIGNRYEHLKNYNVTDQKQRSLIKVS